MPSERWDATPDDDNMQGSPELVIEVLSPSNTEREMQEKATLYLATGAQEFWLVDAKWKNVTVVAVTAQRCTRSANEFRWRYLAATSASQISLPERKSAQTMPGYWSTSDSRIA